MKYRLKYQDGITKRICMWLAASERKKFASLIRSGEIQIPAKNFYPDFDIISFSGKRDLEEQVLSIFSFLFQIGTPQRWTIYSDGSYEQKDKDILLNRFSFVKFQEWNDNKSLNGNELLEAYLKTCHLSKKLHAILGHDYERQTMYVDSDVVFYNNAFAYFNSNILKQGFWYIPETNWTSFKEQGIQRMETHFELNSGLLILNKNFSFDKVFEYLESLNFKFEYFSEQKSFNYSFKKQNGNILDPRQFVVSLEDQFWFSNAFESDKIAARHYVNPVRHKMWQKGWKWHFKD